MNSNDKKAFDIANERAQKEKCIIKRMHLIDGKYWFAPLPKEYEKATKVYDVNGVYIVNPSDWSISTTDTFELIDAMDNAKDKKEIDLSNLR